MPDTDKLIVISNVALVIVTLADVVKDEHHQSTIVKLFSMLLNRNGNGVKPAPERSTRRPRAKRQYYTTR